MDIQENTDTSFCDLVGSIVGSEEFCRMRQYKHHLHGSTYDHSIKVAYLCYRYYQKHPGKVNLNELIRGALLHDYFLYDRHDKSNRVNGLKHGFTHPKRALENAVNAYPDLTETEQDMIRRHMFPLTPIPPRTRCGWLLCFYDKVAAVGDYCGKHNKNYARYRALTAEFDHQKP